MKRAEHGRARRCKNMSPAALATARARHPLAAGPLIHCIGTQGRGLVGRAGR